MYASREPSAESASSTGRRSCMTNSGVTVARLLAAGARMR